MNNNELTLSVTQLNEYVKLLIDSDELLQTAVVRGEISNFKHHYATGHLYFSLKDEKSLVKCVMFARDASRLRFEPDNGMTVTIWGRVSVFPRDGAYQFYAGFMSQSGLGDQHAAFEHLKNKLMNEGLFDQERKRAIPQFPKKIGIITSPTGAAIQDIMNILHRRWPVVNTELYPALVQGEGAAASLLSGVKYFVSKNNVDLIIIGRGGGSGEDLSAFNDEALARAIAASKIPVISAVGHETDVSISDFVADLRAPTPSAAAELAVPDIKEYLASLDSLLKRSRGIITKNLEHAENRLKMLGQSPVLTNPVRYVELRENELLYFAKRIDASYRNILSRNEAIFADKVGRFESLNPLSVLSRGYSFVQKDNRVVSSAEHLKSGDDINLTFSDGNVEAVVK